MSASTNGSAHLAFNTVLYRRSELAPAVAEIAGTGYAALELQPHLTVPLLDDPAAVASLTALLDAERLRVAAVMCGYLFDAASLALNLKTTKLAKKLGAPCLIVLPPRPEMCSAEGFDVLLRELGDEAGALEVAVAVHHHAGTIVDDAPAIDRFLERTAHPAVGLCFDVAHYALFADDEVDAAKRYAPRTIYVHVKDLARRSGELGFEPGVRNAQQSFRVTGDGLLEMTKTLTALRDGGFGGYFSAEVENFYRSRADSLATSHNRILGALA